MKILMSLLLVLFSLQSWAVDSVKKDQKEKDPKAQKNPVAEADLNKLQKNIVTTPKFSSESLDQEKVDQDLQKQRAVLHSSTIKHIVETKKCGKLGTREAIVACQKEAQSKSN